MKARSSLGRHHHGVALSKSLVLVQWWAWWVLRCCLFTATLVLDSWRYMLRQFRQLAWLCLSSESGATLRTSEPISHPSTLFIFLNILCRAFQGVGTSFSFQTSKSKLISAVTCASIVFNTKFASVFAFINISYTGGIGFGPPLGGLLYLGLGYSGPFFILGGCALLYGAVLTPWVGFQFE